MLLRNRSRAVNKPTTLMADHTSHHQPSPKPNQNNNNYARTNIIPSQFCTPKFRYFTMKCCLSEALPSPTSILDTRTLSSFRNNPFSSCEITTMTPRIHSERGIGLALDENCTDKPSSGSVLFGTQLRVKNSTLSSHESKTCDADFGTKKIKDSQKDDVGSSVLSLSEMELSEDYTCVISHGANPRTTHIFGNCIVESYYCSSQPMNNNQNSDSSVSFLSFCYTCKKHLEQTKDIFIYRGDRAFCSQECRHLEMVLDGAENSEF